MSVHLLTVLGQVGHGILAILSDVELASVPVAMISFKQFEFEFELYCDDNIDHGNIPYSTKA